ncbi:hypothetical protein [Nocardia sp. NPDC005366]|uniref:hypothetical protein n=1 Tax=Nocardia sp. NPDC005366 TaxID=3156878 RepID=UPI0033BBD97B
MRPIGAVSAIIAVAVLTLGLSGCDDAEDDPLGATPTATAAATTATTTGATPTLPARTPRTPPPVVEPIEISCGTAQFGLTVSAVTTRGDAACPAAVAVTDIYAARSQAWGDDVVITVAVGTGVWDCREPPAAAIPFQECVNQDNPAEKIRMGS